MNILKRLTSKILQSCYEVFGSWNRHKIGWVYMVHNVGASEGEFNIPTDRFEQVLKCLSQQNVIRLEAFEQKDGFVALSIDDVPVSFYYNGYPLLKKYGIPFTLFVSCSLLNTEGYITEGMLQEMSKCDLCTVGSHGWKHDYYFKLDASAARNDLESSKKRIEKIIGKTIDLYAFPYGSFYACGIKHIKIVADYYKYGFSTVACPITKPSLLPFYFLPRMNITNEVFEIICN